MAATIPDKFLDLFSKRSFGMFGTIMPDGHPQVTPVWVDLQDGEVIVNTAKGRQKDHNVRRDPRITITLIDPDNPYRYLEIRGRVTDITEQGADEHIDKMAMKYMGKEKYPFRARNEVREILKIRPEHVSAFGG
jgi:PPOX class probable F420-dependent enzyme